MKARNTIYLLLTLMNDNNNPNRKEYNLLTNNCGTFVAEVLKQDILVKENAPIIIDPRPNSMVKEYQKRFKSMHYNPDERTLYHIYRSKSNLCIFGQ